MSKYVDLIKLPTQYAKRMQYLSNRIFGEVGKLENFLQLNFQIKFRQFQLVPQIQSR